MNREQWLVAYAGINGLLWLAVLLDRFLGLGHAGWAAPIAGFLYSISLCLMLYIYFREKGVRV